MGEMFIHHEDVRRAQTGWEPRQLDDATVRALGRGLPIMARLTLAKAPARVTAAHAGRQDAGHRRPGTGADRDRRAAGAAAVHLRPRRRAAGFDGDAALVDAVCASRRGPAHAMSGKIRLGLGAAALFAATGLALSRHHDRRPAHRQPRAGDRTEPCLATADPNAAAGRPRRPASQELDPDAKGSVYIEAESGMRCKITRDNVQCESQFAHAPLIGARRANNVYVSADGACAS